MLYDEAMKRTQLQLDDRTYEALRARAYGKRQSVACVVREALQEYLKPELKRTPRVDYTLLSFIGSCKDRSRKFRPVSERHDEALAEAYKR